MNLCQFVPIGERKFRCVNCNWKSKTPADKPPPRLCQKPPVATKRDEAAILEIIAVCQTNQCGHFALSAVLPDGFCEKCTCRDGRKGLRAFVQFSNTQCPVGAWG